MKKILIITLIVVLLVSFSIIFIRFSSQYKRNFNIDIKDNNIQIVNGDHTVGETETEEDPLIGLNILSYINLSTPTYSLIINEDLAFIGRNYEVDIISVIDKKNPEKISSIKHDDWARENGWAINMAKDEDHLYLGENYKINIVRITDIYNPVFISSIDLDGFDLRVKSDKNFLYAATSVPADEESENTNLYVIDIKDLNNPKIEVKIKIKEAFYCMDEKDKLIFLAGKGRFIIFDVTNLDDPFILKEIKIKGWGNDILIKESIVYMVGSEGLTIIDISESDNPVIIKTLDLGGYGKKIFLNNNNAFILCDKENSNGNLIIVDINDKQNPAIVYDASIEGIPRQIFVDSDHVYLTSTDIYEYDDDAEEAEYVYGRLYIMENIDL